MKYFFCLLLLWSFQLSIVKGQSPAIDSLQHSLAQTKQDTNRVYLLTQMASRYNFYKLDSAILLATQAINLSRQLQFSKGELQALNILGEALHYKGELPQALEAQFKALQIAKKNFNKNEEANCLSFIGIIYVEISEYKQGLKYLHRARQIHERASGSPQNRIIEFTNKIMESFTLSWIGEAYERMSLLDSALHFQKKAYMLSLKLNQQNLRTLILSRLGNAEGRMGHGDQALGYYRQAHHNAIITKDLLNQSQIKFQIAQLYQQLKRSDSSMHYAQLAFWDAKRVLEQKVILSTSSLLVQHYQTRNQLDSAFYYLQVAMAAKDSLFGPQKLQRLQMLTFTEKQRQQQMREAQVQLQNRYQRIGLFTTLVVFLIIALLLWRTNHQQKSANQILSQKNLQIETQRHALEQTVYELKTTQDQLIQKEKMASLGELTAGIAHEIQNPLNFVNNFSEVNAELIQELQQEVETDNKQQALALSEDIRENNQKIYEHGKRADAIVKNMLQHARSSSGEKQPTDINVLAEEYLRLSYHGLRAKDKEFNASLIIDLDKSIAKVEVVQQDLGRVLLNLYNNAFYATQQKKAQLNGQYEPEVKVSTCQHNGQVEIKVRDNGTGISAAIKNKIFQPFFTTKPTGQGTGLGLSLSYDIITKGHGGEIKVKGQEGEYSEFIVKLPV